MDGTQFVQLYGGRGVIIEHNTRGTLVLNARRFGPKRVFCSFNYKTEEGPLFSFVIENEEGPLGLKCTMCVMLNNHSSS